MFRLRSLSGLFAFDAAARHNSLTLAAKELGRTQSAVSQQVKGLEEELGLQLFVRRPREVTLTPAGRALAATLGNAFKDIEQTVSRLQQSDEPNVLRLTTYQSFAIHWLIPRLPRFSLKHPEIDVRINADDQRLDLQAQGMDLAIRVGNCPEGALYLGAETFTAMHAPSLSPDGEIAASDVPEHRMIAHEHGHLWREWFDANDVTVDRIDVETDYSHSGLLVQAAAAGGGIALAPPLIAGDSITAGRLKCIEGKALPTGCEYFIEAAESEPPKKVTLFNEWILEEAQMMQKEHPEWFH
ncbi:MAG: LysR family transcriptional regulator [Kordiimonadaceae bacterium]|nr:LysR family transcriptional regulator [Kordiimonadaceae bacterium]MBO6569356.1 LysR family transcriptional regulator [Kordiimonadaceae bacterium]MBO6964831.1 LysR family transcriptional regulator [Kordiimonadaceae bacterium]